MKNVQQVAAAVMRAAANAIYDNGRRPLVAMFGNDERGLSGHYAIYCIFGDAGCFQVLKAVLKEDARLEFPSLVPIIPAAAWYEREIHDLFGLVPKDHPDLRPLVLHENWPQGQYPLRKDFAADQPVPQADRAYPLAHVQGEGVFEVPVGPIHAGIIEPGHFRFSQAGENVIQLDAKLFFTHRGIEKAAEGRSVATVLYLAERICGGCSVANALAFAQAAERLAGAAVPPRAQYLRVLAAELERLYNHVGDIGNLCAGVGFAAGVSHGSRMKELLMRLNERMTGNRFLRGLVVLGGVSMDITPEIGGEIMDIVKLLDTDFRETVELLRENGAFLDRINRTGILPWQAARDLGVVGVAARASGIDADVRRDYPYAVYPELDFKVPVYHSGDVAARLWVRVDEVTQSAQIIRQILARLPALAGPLAAAIPPIKPYSASFGWTESARGATLHWLMAGEENTVYRYFVRSASYANWPALTVAAPGNIIPDFPLINKSFELCYACTDR